MYLLDVVCFSDYWIRHIEKGVCLMVVFEVSWLKGSRDDLCGGG